MGRTLVADGGKIPWQVNVSRDWLDGFCIPGEQRFRLANSAEGHRQLTATIREMPGAIKVGFEATGGQEWVLWATLVEAEIEAVQLPPAQIKAFALSRGTRAKTDRIDAELIARFMLSGQRQDERCQVKAHAFSGP